MRVTAQVKLETERSIRAVARKLFVRKGLHDTNTREIALAAGIAPGTLFNYFPSKEALAVAIVADEFAAGRSLAAERLAERRGSLEEDLFTLVVSDIRALGAIRSFVTDVLEAGLSPFAASAISPEAEGIRSDRVADAGTVLARHGLGEAATPAVMHLYWSLYLGVLSYWSRDASPNQEDTLALLDQTVRMFAGSLQRSPGVAGTSGVPVARSEFGDPPSPAGASPGVSADAHAPESSLSPRNDQAST